MFIGMSMVAIFVAVLLAGAAVKSDSEDTATLIRHARQDARLACYLLTVVILLLGVVLEKMP